MVKLVQRLMIGGFLAVSNGCSPHESAQDHPAAPVAISKVQQSDKVGTHGLTRLEFRRKLQSIGLPASTGPLDMGKLIDTFGMPDRDIRTYNDRIGLDDEALTYECSDGSIGLLFQFRGDELRELKDRGRQQVMNLSDQ